MATTSISIAPRTWCSYSPRDGAVVFLSGEYRGHAGVRRLYGTWFQNFFTKGVNGPV